MKWGGALCGGVLGVLEVSTSCHIFVLKAVARCSAPHSKRDLVLYVIP